MLYYRDFLEYIVLPNKKDKLREKMLKRINNNNSNKNLEKKKKPDDQQSMVSGVSNQTDNSVERRK